jgi:A/G-specific adenine glycosylase
MAKTKIETVQEALLEWFRANGRNLPWRETRVPYRILVSEVMLQQTQVDRVIPYYVAFLERFPTVEALAAAPTADVITAWAGLGYNRRAVNLQRTARYVVEKLGGRFPENLDDLKRLPGVGPYTAGAIAAFAFEQEVAFLDTNMRRVVHRIFFGVDLPKATASEAILLESAAALVPPGEGWSWNQALIEFGAIQCTRRRPACVFCPVQRVCCAYPQLQTAIATLPAGMRLKNEADYAGSNRFYRGRVVAALCDRGGGEAASPLTLAELGPLVRDDFSDEHLPWLYGVVSGLERDGLAKVAEDAPRYESDALANPNTRVSLP